MQNKNWINFNILGKEACCRQVCVGKAIIHEKFPFLPYIFLMFKYFFKKGVYMHYYVQLKIILNLQKEKEIRFIETKEEDKPGGKNSLSQCLR